jgi:hypothetical protein
VKRAAQPTPLKNDLLAARLLEAAERVGAKDILKALKPRRKRS